MYVPMLPNSDGVRRRLEYFFIEINLLVTRDTLDTPQESMFPYYQILMVC